MMVWLVRLCRGLLRRAVLLLAVIASLGAPAFAASMAGGAAASVVPPCHEARMVATGSAGIASPMAGHHDTRADAERAPHAGAHALPLCCATACVIALPPPAVLPLPGAVLRPLWETLPGPALDGRAPGIPVPPPRVS
ncbi:hypothetical protein [Ancylobacter terrae]|uniref:hypothetical protein n=1 Tax=Ancylobacter sp. sgz301288 TaxID=3342077 RepID=UPI00385A68F9